MDCKLARSFSATEDITITATVGDIITTMAISMAVGIPAAGTLAGMMAEDIRVADIRAADMTAEGAEGAAMVVEEEVADFGSISKT